MSLSMIDECFKFTLPLFSTTQTLPFPLFPTLAYQVRLRMERDPTKIQIRGRSCPHGPWSPVATFVGQPSYHKHFGF